MRGLLPFVRHVPYASTSTYIIHPSSLRTYATHTRKGKEKAVDEPDPHGEWQLVVGLEIHAQIKTPRKLFSNARTSHNDPVNTHVDLLDAATPGALPVLNHEAVRLALITALALQCTINPRSTFDRKHYFYHDIPSCYQITQAYSEVQLSRRLHLLTWLDPLARQGRLELQSGDNGVERNLVVGIQQLQIEQDTAKSQDVGQNRLADLNRAGTGLMEIVTDPDMSTAAEAGAFVRRLQALLRRLGSGDGDMEKGNLRVDANVSVNRIGSPLGTRCEIKNLNSVRLLQTAIESERRRQIRHYISHPKALLQRETRGLNEATGETYSLRSKEAAEDYRYMPDANLPAMVITPSLVGKLHAGLPELPWETIDRLITTYGFHRQDVDTLIGLDESDFTGVRYLEAAIGNEPRIGKKAMNLLVHETLGQLAGIGRLWTLDVMPPKVLGELARAVEAREVTSAIAKAIVAHFVKSPSTPAGDLASIMAHLGLVMAEKPNLEDVCQQAVAAQPKAAEAVRAGKEAAVARIVGEVMKRTQGAANAQEARELLLRMLQDNA